MKERPFSSRKSQLALLAILTALLAWLGGGDLWNWMAGKYRYNQAFTLLEAADRLELMSLDTINRERQDYTDPTHPVYFHQYPILGTAVITNKKELDEIRRVVRENVVSGQIEQIIAMCFNPRHGIRVERNGHKLDILICFECYRIETFTDGSEGEGFFGNSAGEQIFNDILTAHGLSPPPQWPERRQFLELPASAQAANSSTVSNSPVLSPEEK